MKVSIYYNIIYQSCFQCDDALLEYVVSNVLKKNTTEGKTDYKGKDIIGIND